LKTVFLAGLAGNKLVAVPRILAEDADGKFGYKAGADQPQPEQFPNPFGILFIVSGETHQFN
jgi:hypothetical protein